MKKNMNIIKDIRKMLKESGKQNDKIQDIFSKFDEI